jgi:hypothetical protein
MADSPMAVTCHLFVPTAIRYHLVFVPKQKTPANRGLVQAGNPKIT